ncbi:MAG: hypothetical protein ACXVJT_14195, partial [Thermoanaerobaculia bacterium]
MRNVRFALAVAGIALAVQAAPAVDLIAPRGGAVLEGGRETEIAWSAAALPRHVEEWEAFLSIDGGKYYGARITPHLDAGIRSFRWRVPNVAASNVRILIRIGDERDETAIEFPQTFTIVANPARVGLDESDVTITEAGGEPALPEAPPIVEWVSGDRDGAGLVTHRHRDRAEMDGRHILADAGEVAAAYVSGASSLVAPLRTASATIRSTPAPRGMRIL